MQTRAIIASLIAIALNVAILAAGATAVLSAPADSGGVAAYLLPAMMTIGIFVSPVIGWVLAPTFGRSGLAWRR